MKDILYRNRQIIFFLLGPIFCLLILQCPAPEGLGHKGMKHLAAAAWILVWWITELFPLGAVSLLSILIYGIVDVMPPVKAYAIFANSNLMLMVGAMMILGAWKDSGLITRYAYWVLSSAVDQGTTQTSYVGVRLCHRACFHHCSQYPGRHSVCVVGCGYG